MSSTPAVLKGKITLDDNPFNRGLKKATAAAGKFGKEVGSRLKQFITHPLGAIGAAVSGFLTYRAFEGGIHGAIATGAALEKLHKKTGVSVGSLASLQEIFKTAGVDNEFLNTGLIRMQRNLFMAAKGGGGLNAMLRDMGLDIDTIAKLQPDAQFAAIGQAINKIDSPMKRTAYAMQTFGRTGAELLPVFAELGDIDLSNLSVKAKLFEDNAEQFHKTEVAINKAKIAASKVWIGIAAEVAPAMEASANKVAKYDWAGLGKSIGQNLAKGIRFVGTVDWGAFFGSITTYWHAAYTMIKGGAMSLVNWLGGLGSRVVSMAASVGLKIAGIFGGSKIGEMLGVDKISQALKAIKDGADDDLKNTSIFDPGDVSKMLAASVNEMNLSRELTFKFTESLKRAWEEASKKELPDFSPKVRMHQRDLLGPSRGIQGASLNGTGGSLKDRTNPTSRYNTVEGFQNPLFAASIRLKRHNDPFALTGGLSQIPARRTVTSLLSRSEQNRFSNQAVASGQARGGSTENAFNAVRSGDARRRKEFQKEQERGKLGIDKTNEILETRVGGTLDRIEALL